MSRSVALFTLMALAAGVAGGVLIGNGFVHGRGGAAARPAPTVPASVLDLQESFAEISEHIIPSVVHINTRAVVEENLGVWWLQPRAREISGAGSGVIVDKEGHIVTNYHVIRGAAELIVKFMDGRRFDVTVVGFDEMTDIAVLKIDPPEDIVPATLGNSDTIRVGEWVLAVGSPFGLDHTVTAGIVSATGRRVGRDDARDFIQTDAAINPGNSGGALVNIKGEVIGINTMIVPLSGTTVSSGVSFAISANLVKWIAEKLIKEGKAVRGYLGVSMSDLTTELVADLRHYMGGYKSLDDLLKHYGLKKAEGVFIVATVRGFPAAKAGIAPGDILIEFNGKPVKDTAAFRFLVMDTPPGTKVDIVVIRSDGKRTSLSATLVPPPSQGR